MERGRADSYNYVVRTYRKNYADLLRRTNQKILELRGACIRDEILSDLRCASLLELSPLNIATMLRDFDAEFPLLFASNSNGTPHIL
jgi:hypothetical protein